MNSRSVLFSLCAASAIALTGCDWGSSGDNTWNDAYAWANFTGTYRFTQAIVATAKGDDDGSSSGVHESSLTAFNGKLNSAGDGATIQLIADKGKKGDDAIVRGSVTVQIKDIPLVVNPATGGISYSGHSLGNIDYAGGVITITGAAILGYPGGTSVTGKYKYYENDTVPPTEKTVLSYLNVIQKGNKVTMSGDSGIVYSGQLTGASMGSDGYVAAQTVYLSFSVASGSGDKITGSFSGVWSGAGDSTFGNMTQRQIHGTLSNGTTFVGTAADVTISVPQATVSE